LSVIYRFKLLFLGIFKALKYSIVRPVTKFDLVVWIVIIGWANLTYLKSVDYNEACNDIEHETELFSLNHKIDELSISVFHNQKLIELSAYGSKKDFDTAKLAKNEYDRRQLNAENSLRKLHEEADKVCESASSNTQRNAVLLAFMMLIATWFFTRFSEDNSREH
jgi:hypothetical protein